MKLTDIREAVEKKYVSLPIEFQDEAGDEHVLELRNVLRMEDAEQETIDKLMQKFDGLKKTSEARLVFIDLLEALSGDPEGTRLFVDTINNDLAVMMYIVTEYTKVTQAEKA